MSQKAGHWSWKTHFNSPSRSLISFFCCSSERVTIWRLITLSLTTVLEGGEGELIVYEFCRSFFLLYQKIGIPRVYWGCDLPPCDGFHVEPDLLILGQTLSCYTAASQEYSLKIMNLCRSHFRKKKKEIICLVNGNWINLLWCFVWVVGGFFVNIEEKSNLKTFCLSRFLVSLTVSFSVSLMQLCLQPHALAMQSRFLKPRESRLFQMNTDFKKDKNLERIKVVQVTYGVTVTLL